MGYVKEQWLKQQEPIDPPYIDKWELSELRKKDPEYWEILLDEYLKTLWLKHYMTKAISNWNKE